MARKPRGQILYDGCYGHIYSRAIGHQEIFKETDDFEYFKSLLQLTRKKFGYRIHHYCLMNTHYHLLVSISSVDEFSRGMKELKRLYANKTHATGKRYGPIWWGRFGSQLVENEKYLYACGLYIEMNPVEAGMVIKPELWPYSSSRHYFLGEEDLLIDEYNHLAVGNVDVLKNKIDLERGDIIGSELFKIHVEEGLLNAL